jgi:PPK2 family polyphosphate:nucleotide phosphotransferase
MNIDKLRLAPGTHLEIAERAAARTHGMTKERAEAARAKLGAEFADLQELLYAAGKNALLIVLQGMDTSGKDGTIKNVMDPVNPVGVRVTSFKTPSATELAHDYLWRVHKEVPERGIIGIFNRSHYEEVLIVRVHELVDRHVWRKRFRQIVDFERLLADSGTIVLKFFLHISLKEQEERLLAREQEVEKAWKLAVGDYRLAYEDAITKTNTEAAPWYIIPADKKWARNYFVLSAVVDALRPYRESWLATLAERGQRARAELEAFRATKT